MTIRKTIAVLSLMSVLVPAFAVPAHAQVCTRHGVDVSCNDGRRGVLSGDAIIWPDGTRSSSAPHPSMIIGNKRSVHVGLGVFVGQDKGMVPMIPTRRTNGNALFWMACRIAIENARSA